MATSRGAPLDRLSHSNPDKRHSRDLAFRGGAHSEQATDQALKILPTLKR